MLWLLACGEGVQSVEDTAAEMVVEETELSYQFTIAILAIEADYFKNTTNNMIMFDEVIVEELRKKNVGEAMISGQPV